MNWLRTYDVLGNSMLAWGSAATITAAVLAVFAIVRWLLCSRLGTLARAGSRADRVLESVVHTLRGTRLWLLLFPALHVGLQALDLPGRIYTLAGNAAAVALILQIGLWGARQIRFWITDSRARAEEADIGATTSLGALNFIATTILWALVLLLILQNLGVDITALIAGLGVGGIAVALAVQNILGDLFASLSIVTDKPFVVGDFVVVGEYAGTIEHVGLKTTRLRSLSGEQLVFANSDMLSARLRNYKRMETRRIVFGFGVPHTTTHDQLAAIPGMVRGIVDDIEATTLDRCHFLGIGPTSYDFETVHIVNTPDYNAYMDVQQAINLALVQRFEAAGITFAQPVSTLRFAEALPLTRASVDGVRAAA